MSGRPLTHPEYTIQPVVGLFSELLSQFAEAGLTRSYQDIFSFCRLENIDYRELRFLNISAHPFEQWAEEWLHEREVKSSYTKETEFGGG